MRELESAVLKRSLPEHGLEEGDVGTIVHRHSDDAFELEFVSGEGRTIAVVTLSSSDIRPISGPEILHVRSLPS